LADSVDGQSGPVFGETFLCLQAASAGMGLAIGDNITAYDFLERGELVIAHPVGLRSSEAYYLVFKSTQISQIAISFIDWIRATFADFEKMSLQRCNGIQVTATNDTASA
jgi:LysR family transcriptional regulator, glycine cleavage system transcriptional activator